jgi:hypothetical protein
VIQSQGCTGFLSEEELHKLENMRGAENGQNHKNFAGWYRFT